MINLIELTKKYPDHYLVQRYNKQLKESWTKGRYYLGAQIPLTETDEITDEIIRGLKKMYFEDPLIGTNQWEQASIERGCSDFCMFLKIYSEQKACTKET